MSSKAPRGVAVLAVPKAPAPVRGARTPDASAARTRPHPVCLAPDNQIPAVVPTSWSTVLPRVDCRASPLRPGRAGTASSPIQPSPCANFPLNLQSLEDLSRVPSAGVSSMVGTRRDNQAGSASALLVAHFRGARDARTTRTKTSDAGAPCTQVPHRVPARQSRIEAVLPRQPGSRPSALPDRPRRLAALGGGASRPAFGASFQEPS
jgi:hypothetical protein